MTIIFLDKDGTEIGSGETSAPPKQLGDRFCVNGTMWEATCSPMLELVETYGHRPSKIYVSAKTIEG